MFDVRLCARAGHARMTKTTRISGRILFPLNVPVNGIVFRSSNRWVYYEGGLRR